MPEPLPGPDLLPDAVDDLVHDPDGEAEQDYFGVTERVVHPDGVGEGRAFLAPLDCDDVPAVPLDIGQQLPVVVVGRFRWAAAGVSLLPGHRSPFRERIRFRGFILLTRRTPRPR